VIVGSGTTQIGGVTCAGSIRELQPSTGGTVWADCLQGGPVLGAVTAVPGVAFVGAGNTVYAVSTKTGAILWSYQDGNGGSDFWGAPTISNGRVYVGNQDGNLYAFGTKAPGTKVSHLALSSPGVTFLMRALAGSWTPGVSARE